MKEGTPVVCICFTPSLSGSYNCACNAREIVCEDYPDAKIAVINSEAGTVSQGLMVIEAGRMCQNGIPYEQCVDILEKMKKTNRIFLFKTWRTNRKACRNRKQRPFLKASDYFSKW